MYVCVLQLFLFFRILHGWSCRVTLIVVFVSRAVVLLNKGGKLCKILFGCYTSAHENHDLLVILRRIRKHAVAEMIPCLERLIVLLRLQLIQLVIHVVLFHAGLCLSQEFRILGFKGTVLTADPPLHIIRRCYRRIGVLSEAVGLVICRILHISRVYVMTLLPSTLEKLPLCLGGIVYALSILTAIQLVEEYIAGTSVRQERYIVAVLRQLRPASQFQNTLNIGIRQIDVELGILIQRSQILHVLPHVVRHGSHIAGGHRILHLRILLYVRRHLGPIVGFLSGRCDGRRNRSSIITLRDIPQGQGELQRSVSRIHHSDIVFLCDYAGIFHRNSLQLLAFLVVVLNHKIVFTHCRCSHSEILFL